MPCQVVWSFSEAGQGWAETYQISSNDPSSYIQLSQGGSLQSATPARAFLDARKGLLNGSSSITHVRCSLIGSPGTVLAAGVSALDGTGTFRLTGSPRPGTGSETFAKLLVRIQCGTTRRRTLWLGGIPEEVVTPPQTYTPVPSWIDALSAFRNTLIGGGTTYGIAGRPSRTSPPVAQQIVTFIPDGSGYTAAVGIISSVGFPTVPGQYVIVRGLRYPRGWNGVHLGQVTDATHVEIGPLRLPGHVIPAQRVGDSGTIQVFNVTFSQYTNIVAERVTRRKVGLPFGESRGRGPAR